MSRPSLGTTMLGIASLLAQRATCSKLKVGCVLTDDQGRILGTGYNGVPRGCMHCTDVPCAGASAPAGADLCEAVHAEQNALLQCYAIERLETCYTTHIPCMRCIKQLMNTNCRHIVYLDGTHEQRAARDLWLHPHGGRTLLQWRI
jgi:dCMP deaminase